MLCKRAFEILNALRGKRDISVLDVELDELKTLGCVSLYEPFNNKQDVEQKLVDLKAKYDVASEHVRTLNKELLGVEHDRAAATGGAKIAAMLGLDPAKKRMVQVKQEMAVQEKTLNEIKQQLLELGLEKETIERAVKIDGHRAFLTPTGEQYTNEIVARQRYFDRPLGDLKHVLERLDLTFSLEISKIESLNKNKNIPGIWAPYLFNIGFETSDRAMPRLGEFDNPDERMLEMTTDWIVLNSPANKGATTIRTRIERFLQSKVAFHLDQVKPVINTIDKMLSAYSPARFLGDKSSTPLVNGDDDGYNEEHIIVDPEKYLKNFEDILKYEWRQETTEPRLDKEDVLAVLFLAFTSKSQSSSWTRTFEYFLDIFKDILDGKKLFAALATAFPWEAEETWMILLRAESNILRGQRAKFVPELLEYAVMLAMNPEIIAIENNISPAQIDAWKTVIIPVAQAIITTSLEDMIYSYIQSRPMSYITSPYYYRRPYGYMHTTSLHYHTTG
ncbi:MAG TPA: hypothetical protein VKM55_03950 [Candidatus Lokiarchaeia archaeon]|nr:hypothetical protein [Candidatus Lokiarchaeia archaeon]